MTRPERRALKDKVALEKGRLMQVSHNRYPNDNFLCCTSYIRLRICPHTYAYVSVEQTQRIQPHNGAINVACK